MRLEKNIFYYNEVVIFQMVSNLFLLENPLDNFFSFLAQHEMKCVYIYVFRMQYYRFFTILFFRPNDEVKSSKYIVKIKYCIVEPPLLD